MHATQEICRLSETQFMDLKLRLCFGIIVFSGGSVGKESACSAGDAGHLGLTPGLGRSPEEGMITHSSILAWRIPMDRGAWWATVHVVAKRLTQLKQPSMHTCMPWNKAFCLVSKALYDQVSVLHIACLSQHLFLAISSSLRVQGCFTV